MQTIKNEVNLGGISLVTDWLYGSRTEQKMYINLDFIAYDTDLAEHTIMRNHSVRIYNECVINAFLEDPKTFIENEKNNENSWVEVFVNFPSPITYRNMSYDGTYVICKVCKDEETGQECFVPGWDPQTRMMGTLNSFNRGIPTF